MDAKPEFSLSGSKVLLLGATGGIGSAIAHELAARNAEIVCVGRNTAALERLAEFATTAAFDLRDPANVQRAVNGACVNGSKLDVVINAAGVVAFGAAETLSIDAMEELFLVNAFVPIVAAQASLPVLNKHGAFANISGVIAEQNLANMAAYGASKAAASSFLEGFRREAKRSGVRVVDFRPGHTESGLADHPIEGTAPKFPPGLTTSHVAKVICDSLESGASDVASTSFA